MKASKTTAVATLIAEVNPTLVNQAEVVGESLNEGVDSDVTQQAIDYAIETAILERVHPDHEDRILHRHGDCDGSCVRAFNGMNLADVDCR